MGSFNPWTNSSEFVLSVTEPWNLQFVGSKLKRSSKTLYPKNTAHPLSNLPNSSAYLLYTTIYMLLYIERLYNCRSLSKWLGWASWLTNLHNRKGSFSAVSGIRTRGRMLCLIRSPPKDCLSSVSICKMAALVTQELALSSGGHIELR